MGNRSVWSLVVLLSVLTVEATPPPKPAKPAGGAGGAGGADLDLSDFFDNEGTVAPKAPPKVAPKATKAPAKPKPKPAGDEFDLSDALDPNNDIGTKDKNKGQGDKGTGAGGKGDTPPNRGGNGGGFSDSDLDDIGKDDTYKPDKGKGGRPGGGSGHIDPSDDNNDTMAETGTIAGIVSAVAMALVGAVSSYISYQKKKLCFSIQQSLNTDMVKAENPEAVVAAEPQVQQTLLEPPNAEPPSGENTV
ncbi:CD99 antigen-like protein 2 [Diretmus argenteus]